MGLFRPTAIGKKNWLFVGHPQAGERAAILYSILISCLRLDINPTDYLKDVISIDTRVLDEDQRAAFNPARWKKSNST